MSFKEGRVRISTFQPIRSPHTGPDPTLYLPEKDISTREECIEVCYLTPLFSDITLLVGPPANQKTYNLHRLVLAGQSPVLHTLCTSIGPAPPDGHPLPALDPDVFDLVVKWLYKARITNRTEDLTLLARTYEAANTLKIAELEQAVIDSLRMIVEREKSSGGMFGGLFGREKDGVSILDSEEGGGDSVIGGIEEHGVVVAPSGTPQATATIGDEHGGTGKKENVARKVFKELMGKVSPKNSPAKTATPNNGTPVRSAPSTAKGTPKENSKSFTKGGGRKARGGKQEWDVLADPESSFGSLGSILGNEVGNGGRDTSLVLAGLSPVTTRTPVATRSPMMAPRSPLSPLAGRGNAEN